MLVWSLIKLYFIFYDFSVIYFDFFKYLAEINKKDKDKTFITKTLYFVLKYTILYIHCVDLIMWSPTELDFPFYNFSVIYYDCSNIQPK